MLKYLAQNHFTFILIKSIAGRVRVMKNSFTTKDLTVIFLVASVWAFNPELKSATIIFAGLHAVAKSIDNLSKTI